MDQTLLNWIFTAVGALISWAVKAIYDAMKDLQKTDDALADKVQAIEVLVAGQYAKRTDVEKMTDAIFAKLDRIENKLDGKADRSHV